MSENPRIYWSEDGTDRSARWRSETGTPPPKRVVIADDTISADTAYRLACEGTALLWRGDFQNARLLLQALARRVDRKPGKPAKSRKPAPTPAEAFHLHRQAQSQRARTLGMLLIPFDAGHVIPLRRAPDVALACEEVYGAAEEPYVASLRELLGLIGAHEWRKNGIPIAVLDGRIHAHYGVFAPTRGEYIDLVAKAPLPAFNAASGSLAFDIGAGTGVLAALLAKRGVKHVIATELDPRALACARENIQRLGLKKQVEITETNLFPPGRASLIVCNPPWVPARPSSALERAIYDPDSQMLRGFLAGLAAHLEPGGESWLILSDLAEHLGLRSRDEFLAALESAGLKVLGRLDARPSHP
ncbi:class I SAM-dependent methyltransferase, partial [bacterium]|nr:class I SAM-dependent methyltransferase [bacterium]